MTSRNPSPDDFSLPVSGHTGLFGVFLGAHAITDSLDVLHAGVGCKAKTQRQLVDHDRGRESHTQVGWTELSEEQLIRDAGAPLLKAIRELYRRRRPGLILITTSTAVDLTSLDVPALLVQARRLVDCPVEWIQAASSLTDMYAGYDRVLQTVLGLVPWNQPVASRPTVSLVGYLFHRHELEQAANLAELRRLTEALGVRFGPCLLDGSSLGVLQGMHLSRALVQFPYLRSPAEDLARSSSRRVVSSMLPLGLRATSCWLRALGQAFDIASGTVEELIQREQARLAPRLDMAQRFLKGRHVAIVADTPLAAGLLLLAGELGLSTQLVILLDRSLGGETALHRQVEQARGSLSPALRIVTTPSVLSLQALAQTEGHGRSAGIDLVLRPDLPVYGTEWADLPTVQIGFPANHKHFLYPMPEMGYNGVAAMAQRMMDAVAGVY